jgi:MFS family permease
MRAIVVLFPVFAITLGNTTVQSTVGLFGRSTGLSEFQVGIFFASSAVLFFLTSSVWGGLADRWGRRPVILTGLAGSGVSFVSAAWIVGPLVGTAAYSMSIEGPLLLAAVALVAGTLGYSVLMATVSRSGGSNTARPAG